MAKEIRKEIMLRSTLKNRYNKERNHINWCNFKRQRQFTKNPKKIFNNLNFKQIQIINCSGNVLNQSSSSSFDF